MSSPGNLKQKAVTGVMWTSIQRFSQIFVGFFSGIVLARLLEPEDYGCIGMLSIFMLVSIRRFSIGIFVFLYLYI